MKKTLLSILLATALPVLAQTAVTAPSAPVVPSTVTVSPNATAALAIATTNRIDRKSTRLNSSHIPLSRMPSSA